MILEGFEIENWSCIKRVAVDGLPPTGVIVLHGPNGTGKSSIVAALRACLLDFPAGSTAKELRHWFPKNSAEKPRISVTFRVQGTSWRITKRFGTKDSQLESRTAAGAWKLEKSTAADAHEQTRLLLGNHHSEAGLQQLLWLTQTEFQLPKAKDFDTDIQQQLRGVLGVLQTPLDDRFVGRLKEQWSRWFGARSKPGETPKLKKDCPLDKALSALAEQRTKLAELDAEFAAFEKMAQRSGDLQLLARGYRQQLAVKTEARRLLQQEYEQSLKRLESHRLAGERMTGAERALTAAQALQQQRVDMVKGVQTADESAQAASRDADEQGAALQAAEQALRESRQEMQRLATTGRELQEQLNHVADRRTLLTMKEKATAAQANLVRAEQATARFDELKKQARERSAPDEATIKALETNRAGAAQARADLEAAAIGVTLIPEPAAAIARLVIDGGAAVEARPKADGASLTYTIRRRAEISIPGWGRAELARGSDTRSIVQVETALDDLNRDYAASLAPYGLAADNPTALDDLRTLLAEKRIREPELIQVENEIKLLAPKGMEAHREEVARLTHQLSAMETGSDAAHKIEYLPTDEDALARLAKQLTVDLTSNQSASAALEQQHNSMELDIVGSSAHRPRAGKSDPGGKVQPVKRGLRQQYDDARESLATLKATADALRGQLNKLPTADQLDHEVRTAVAALDTARTNLHAAKLSESEITIRERLDAADDGLRALHEQLATADREFHQIEGALRQSEGLHQKRSAAAARVEELTSLTERQILESAAVDRLLALFEECREKQLGAVMGPIHDRVLRWMRLLRIGHYQSIQFNDQFLPDALVADGGAIEMPLGEESTGTIEQIGLMVRLALGSALSTVDEPAIAVLDDPLTHSDVVRLELMRAVLKNASAGDANSTPPAGPLQIMVLTCHPEWFAINGAKVIDLSRSDVLSKSS